MWLDGKSQEKDPGIAIGSQLNIRNSTNRRMSLATTENKSVHLIIF